MPDESQVPSPFPAGHNEAADAPFLKKLGDRVREARASRGMTRRILARDSGVSERYLAQLESGQGNISILLLRDIARALGPVPSISNVHVVHGRSSGPPLGCDEAALGGESCGRGKMKKSEPSP